MGAPKLTTLTTVGEITDFTVANTSTVTTIDFGHTFIAGDTAATVTVSGVTKITALDMSSLTKVKTVNVVNNGISFYSCTFVYCITEPIAATILLLWKCFNRHTQAVEGAKRYLTKKRLLHQLN